MMDCVIYLLHILHITRQHFHILFDTNDYLSEAVHTDYDITRHKMRKAVGSFDRCSTTPKPRHNILNALRASVILEEPDIEHVT